MTTANTPTKAPLPPELGRFRLPDIPEKHPDDMTSFKHLAENGMAHSLAVHLGNPDTTLVTGERYIVVVPTQNMAGSHYPDLLVAFDVDPAAYEASNGYVIDEQGKPPDFVLEIASRHTGHNDVGEKREAYEALGITEYWRFDETGQYHGAKLAGDRLVDGRYEAIDIEELADGVLQGYSPALNLHLRWEAGEFALHDPATGRRIATLEDERAARMQEQAAREQAEAGRLQEQAAREQAEAGQIQEQAARMQEQAAREQAEARVRELEAQLQQRDDSAAAGRRPLC